MIQFIEITGMFGVTFWIVSLNVAIFYLYQEKTSVRFIDSLAILILPAILGILISKNSYNENEKIDFAILQIKGILSGYKWCLSSDGKLRQDLLLIRSSMK